MTLLNATWEVIKFINLLLNIYEKRENMSKGDSLTEFPTYIKHWEVAKPWGWQIRILTENGLNIFNCKWKDYKRPRELTKRERCPHN